MTSLSLSIIPVTRAVTASSSPSFLISPDAAGSSFCTDSSKKDFIAESHAAFDGGGRDSFLWSLRIWKEIVGSKVKWILMEFEIAVTVGPRIREMLCCYVSGGGASAWIGFEEGGDGRCV
ncbi:hypothetical protein OIU85_006635 [Salix viminalis]|uniref:Uncharacterized protein n=1 Tax=Salix viminalis TaxID=40686 RepID=A0A9Q0PM89_SALVM|nr:hypothetical protein OIU85_006635 [Salix viminalis]